MFTKHKEQKALKETYNTQTKICECGFPYIPMMEIRYEDIFGIKRIYKEYDGVCRMCGKKYKVVG